MVCIEASVVVSPGVGLQALVLVSHMLVLFSIQVFVLADVRLGSRNLLSAARSILVPGVVLVLQIKFAELLRGIVLLASS